MLSNKLPEGSRPPPQTMDNWLLLCGSARSPQKHARIKVRNNLVPKNRTKRKCQKSVWQIWPLSSKSFRGKWFWHILNMFKPSLHQLVAFGHVTSLFHFFGQSTRFVEEPLHLRFIQSTYQWHISDIHSSMSTHVPVLLLCCLAHRLSRRVFHYKHPTTFQ